MIVCITENPSVAKDIAQILGASVRRDGYYEGNGYQITWTFGHLCCLKDPHDYTDGWRSWNLSTLPMLPPAAASGKGRSQRRASHRRGLCA